jgi:hypothetical protein
MIDDYNIDLLLVKGILAAKKSPVNKALGYRADYNTNEGCETKLTRINCVSNKNWEWIDP